MSLPAVSIVGRPNVGKSSLFNALVGHRASIVEPTPGVTRDRLSLICEIEGVCFELMDTGGYGLVDRDDLSDDVERQIRFAVERAQLILFVVDNREGLTPLDRETAKQLRSHHDRVKLIANKVDEPHLEVNTLEFARLGFGDPLPVSAMNGAGLWALRDLLHERLAELSTQSSPEEPVMHVAVVGKRNVGKSTFINTLAGEERVIVSEIPGTTRDSVDVRFEKDGQVIVAIDTAGMRKQSKLNDDIEYYAYTRMTHAISRADVVLFFIDATLPLGQVDKKLAHLIDVEHKPCVVVFNKWDLVKGRAATDDYGEYLDKMLPWLDFAPVVVTSAITGKNAQSAVDLAFSLFKQARTRVGTGQLNQALQSALVHHPPQAKRGRLIPKFFYATQVATQPPTILLFVNNPKAVSPDYERFLIRHFRERLPFAEIPIRLVYRARRPPSVA